MRQETTGHDHDDLKDNGSNDIYINDAVRPLTSLSSSTSISWGLEKRKQKAEEDPDPEEELE